MDLKMIYHKKYFIIPKNSFYDIDKKIEKDIKGRFYETTGKIYLCTNSEHLHGTEAPDKLGYKFSWFTNKEEIMISGIQIIDDREEKLKRLLKNIPETVEIKKSET